jgi:hypothetical protein
MNEEEAFHLIKINTMAKIKVFPMAKNMNKTNLTTETIITPHRTTDLAVDPDPINKLAEVHRLRPKAIIMTMEVEEEHLITTDINNQYCLITLDIRPNHKHTTNHLSNSSNTIQCNKSK